MVAPETSAIPTPAVDERFVVKPRFKGKIVRMLNADGHTDIAHKMGRVRLKSTLIKQWVEESETTKESDDGEKETFVSRTRWATVLVTATITFPDGTSNECDGLSSANDRDNNVKQPGYEVSVAETRATKRAIANACNITEKFISPDAKEPSREFVDMRLGGKGDDEEANLPSEVLRKPDIRPPIDRIAMRGTGESAEEQFSI